MNRGREFANGAYPRRYEGQAMTPNPGSIQRDQEPVIVKVNAINQVVVRPVEPAPLVPFGNTWG